MTTTANNTSALQQHHFKVFVTITYTTCTTPAGLPDGSSPTASVRQSVRRFSAPHGTTLAQFRALCEALLAPMPEGCCVLAVSYKDSDGDVVEVGSEMEWAEALVQQGQANSACGPTIPILVDVAICGEVPIVANTPPTLPQEGAVTPSTVGHQDEDTAPPTEEVAEEVKKDTAQTAEVMADATHPVEGEAEGSTAPAAASVVPLERQESALAMSRASTTSNYFASTAADTDHNSTTASPTSTMLLAASEADGTTPAADADANGTAYSFPAAPTAPLPTNSSDGQPPSTAATGGDAVNPLTHPMAIVESIGNATTTLAQWFSAAMHGSNSGTGVAGAAGAARPGISGIGGVVSPQVAAANLYGTPQPRQQQPAGGPAASFHRPWWGRVQGGVPQTSTRVNFAATPARYTDDANPARDPIPAYVVAAMTPRQRRAYDRYLQRGPTSAHPIPASSPSTSGETTGDATAPTAAATAATISPAPLYEAEKEALRTICPDATPALIEETLIRYNGQVYRAANALMDYLATTPSRAE